MTPPRNPAFAWGWGDARFHPLAQKGATQVGSGGLAAIRRRDWCSERLRQREFGKQKSRTEGPTLRRFLETSVGTPGSLNTSVCTRDATPQQAKNNDQTSAGHTAGARAGLGGVEGPTARTGETPSDIPARGAPPKPAPQTRADAVLSEGRFWAQPSQAPQPGLKRPRASPSSCLGHRPRHSSNTATHAREDATSARGAAPHTPPDKLSAGHVRRQKQTRSRSEWQGQRADLEATTVRRCTDSKRRPLGQKQAGKERTTTFKRTSTSHAKCTQ